MSDWKLPGWEGPISDPIVLSATPQGTVAVDDVGAIRQHRYGNSYMAGGWTAQGSDPLSSVALVEGGLRPVFIMRPIRRSGRPAEETRR